MTAVRHGSDAASLLRASAAGGGHWGRGLPVPAVTGCEGVELGRGYGGSGEPLDGVIIRELFFICEAVSREP
jgi:hypothetical protein